MKLMIIAAALAALAAGPAAAECLTAPVVDITANAGQDQNLWSIYTGDGWSHAVEDMPSWMRVRRDTRRGYDVIDLWGVPRSGTYKVSVRYTRPEKSILCTDYLRFK